MNMKTKLSCCLLFTIATSSFAFADDAFAEICTTQSHNISFISAPAPVDTATSAVLNECQQNPVTNNADCSNNLSCNFSVQSPYPTGQTVCQTAAMGVKYELSGDPLSIDSLTTAILNDCKASAVSANNPDCSTNLTCMDRSQATFAYPSGQVACSTNSHSINFQQVGAATSVSAVINATLNECQTNPVTNNADCATNLTCADGGSASAAPSGFATCRTESHNIPFVNRGPRAQIDQTVTDLLHTCDTNAVANQTECTQNLSCD